MSSHEIYEFNKKATTLSVTIKPECEPANFGTTGPYFKLTYNKGQKCIKRKELICRNNYPSFSSDNCNKCCNLEKCECYRIKKVKCEICKKSKCSCDNKKEKKSTHLATFVQISDVHLIDGSSPSRSSFLSQYIPEEPILADSFRPYEQFSAFVAECMVRKINAVEKGPHFREKFNFVVNTGDNADGMQFNELQNYINILDGTKVSPNPINNYVGVQDDYPAYNYESYYHPNNPPEGVPFDKYKTLYGYPNFQDILDSASKPFCAEGLKVPWFSGQGNHDCSKLGNYSISYYTMRNLFNQIAAGKIPDLGSKLVESMSPVQAQIFVKGLEIQSAEGVLDILNRSQLREVPPSEKRVQFTIPDYINAHFNTTSSPGPIGHGFTQYNIENNVMYYTFKISDKITGIMLDSCNPNGNLTDPSLAPNGSFGSIQMAWFQDELRKRHSNYFNSQGQLVCTKNKDELIIVFCHHTISTLNNNFTIPTTFDNDPERIMGPEFVKILHSYPNIIALVNGHLHTNVITPFPDPTGRTQGWWEVSSSSHIDFPQQSRIIEIGENSNGTLSIFCTMIDHLSPANAERGCFPTGPARNCCCSNSYSSTKSSESREDSSEERCKEKYSIEEIASISRELSYNDVFIVDEFDTGENRTGTPLDQNVELLLFNPLLRCK